jgi:hypothetical protein
MMEIATPVYGYKSHVGVNRRHRFIRTSSVTAAVRDDGRELAGLLDRNNTGSSVWADTACRSAKNEKAHYQGRFGLEGVFPEASRSGVEHVFADQKHRMAPFIRAIGIARARARIGHADIACKMRRHQFWETAAAPVQRAPARDLGTPIILARGTSSVASRR